MELPSTEKMFSFLLLLPENDWGFFCQDASLLILKIVSSSLLQAPPAVVSLSGGLTPRTDRTSGGAPDPSALVRGVPVRVVPGMPRRDFL